MSKEFRIDYIKTRSFIVKVLSVLAFLVVGIFIAFKGKEVLLSCFLFTASLLVITFFDETIQKSAENVKIALILHKIKCFLYFLLIIAASAVQKPVLVIVVIFSAVSVFIIAEDVVFDDFFDSSFGYIYTVIFSILMAGGIFLPYILDGYDLYEAVTHMFCVGGIILSNILIRKIVIRMAVYWDEKYNDILFANVDLKAENEKLLMLQNRIEEVNSTINYQKVQLTETNSNLERRNQEIHALMDVMVEYSKNFDVREDIESLLKSIMDVKNASVVSIYLEENSCLNDEALFSFKSTKSYASDRIRKDTEGVFEELRKRKNKKKEPLIIAENYTQSLPFFERKGSCIAAFPLFDYETENVYGVLVVVGEKLDFFNGGYDYYKTSVIDFTAALISDRLYLTMEDMAKRDGLTKIYNRIYFNTFYEEYKKCIVEENRTMSMLMSDIDHFKHVNDTYGHLAGDEAIKVMARLQKEIAKKYGGKAVRFGGEEFILVFPDKTLDETRAIAAELHENIKSVVIKYDNYEIKINASIGIANYPETVDNIVLLLDKSDKAMYYSKTHGRGRVVVDGEWDPE